MFNDRFFNYKYILLMTFFHIYLLEKPVLFDLVFSVDVMSELSVFYCPVGEFADVTVNGEGLRTAFEGFGGFF